MSSVDDIKAKLDIVEVVGSYISLTRAGNSYKAQCPFHNERTPSFTVSPERQAYYCFGCGAGGDMVNFVEQIEGVDFRGAMNILADQAGTTFDSGFRSKDRGEDDQLQVLTEAAAEYFQSRLSEHPPVRQYLVDRGVSEASIALWRLGYAPGPPEAGWRSLLEHLRGQGWSEEIILRAGLSKRSSRGGRVYDVFRHRVIFPLKDPAGRVVAFSGRDFLGTEEAPKYLNSPDTPIFHKSSLLYGLDRAKAGIRKWGFSVMVEGQFDLLLSHQHGFTNTVATSGTAVTREHLLRLSRLSPNIILAFDSDAAGVKAAQKTAAIALPLGMTVKVAVTPTGQDPADILSTEGTEGWKSILTQARPLVLFLLDWVTRSAGGDEPKMARLVNTEVLPFVAALSRRSEQSTLIKQIAGQSGIREDALWEDLARSQPAGSGEASGEEGEGGEEAPAGTDSGERDRLAVIGRHLAGLILWQESQSEPSLDPADLRARLIRELGSETAEEFLAQMKQDPGALFNLEEKYGREPLAKRDIEDLFTRLSLEQMGRERDRLSRELSRAEAGGDPSRVRELLSSIQEIQSRIDSLHTERSDN